MSQGAFAFTKEGQRLCASCRDHTVCFECFRAERERRRARMLAEVAPTATARLEPRRSLTSRDVDHRRRMLAHLAQASRMS